MEPTMHELLVRTRNEIARRGHTQWILQELYGEAVCLYGGFNLARFGNALRWSAADVSEEFADALGFDEPEEGEITDHPIYGPVPTFTRTEVAVNWNNAPGRTKEEVLALLDEAIARTAPAPEDPLSNGVREEVAA